MSKSVRRDIGVESVVYTELRTLRQNRQLRQIYEEQKHHDNWLQIMRWENSPERFALVRQLKESSLSYGYQQAALYEARMKWIRTQEEQSGV